MKKKLSQQLMQELKDALHNLNQNLQLNNEKKEDALKQAQLQQQQATTNALCNQELADIQNELFQTFSGNHYPYTAPITTPSDIIPLGYKLSPNGVLYGYNVLSTTMQNIPHCVLQQIKPKMNTDIYRAQQQLLAQYPFNYAAALYPYIINGLYIMDVKQDGMYLTLTVAHN